MSLKLLTHSKSSQIRFEFDRHFYQQTCGSKASFRRSNCYLFYFCHFDFAKCSNDLSNTFSIDFALFLEVSSYSFSLVLRLHDLYHSDPREIQQPFPVPLSYAK